MGVRANKKYLFLSIFISIVDAQLPKSLADWLNSKGLDCLHTSGLPSGNRSDDNEISLLADREGRMVISKDKDFWDDHVIKGCPKKLLIIKTGNIVNTDLLTLFKLNIERIEELFLDNNLIELNRQSIIVHL